jgi:hypothetical protein
MGGEEESDGLKKKRPIGPQWLVSSFGPVSNRIRETNPEGNECWRFDLNYTSDD